jgi:uncharacterized protein YciI
MDKPSRLELRMATRPKHLEYINGPGVKERFVIGGPILSEDRETMLGSFFILEVTDRAAAEAHIEGDPYCKAGLFESVVIRPFRKVLP